MRKRTVRVIAARKPIVGAIAARRLIAVIAARRLMAGVAAAAVAVAAVAVAGCGSSSSGSSTTETNVSARGSKSAGGQVSFSAQGMSIHFEYPPAFKVVPLAQDRQAAGNTTGGTHAGIAIGPYDLLTVTRYPGLTTPVSAQNIGSFKQTFDGEVSQVLRRNVTSTVSNDNGIPLLTWPREPVVGLPVKATVQILNAFVGRDEYEIQCQATPQRLAQIAAACREAIETLHAS